MADTQPDAMHVRMAHKRRTRRYSLHAVESMVQAALGQAHAVLEQAGDDAPLRQDAVQVVEELETLLARLGAQRVLMKAGEGR